LVKPQAAFNKRMLSADGRQSRCRDCSHDWYLASRVEHIANTARRKRRVREQLQDRLARYLLEHPCIDCGESDIRCLDFDHVDPTTKVAEISIMVGEVWPWDRVIAEIAKCVVRCSNCHRLKEAMVRSLWRHRWLQKHGIETSAAPLGL
jgi:transcription elongation factor Elf1